MSITTKNLYSLVVDEIKKRTNVFEPTQETRSETNSRLAALSSTASAKEILSSVYTVLQQVLPQNIITGLEVVATDPASADVIVSVGKGAVGGTVFELSTETTVGIPLTANVYVWYVCLTNERISVESSKPTSSLVIAKIIVPQPGVTSRVINKKDGSWDAYIQSFKQYYLYGMNDIFEEDTIELLRDNIGEILADNLIGNIRLSENLKIINTSGTLELGSTYLKMYNNGGDLLAQFTTTGAFIGNIAITPHTLESRNFLTNVSGFQISDDGNAEFNNVKLRGTLYTAYISENLYVNEGVTIYGDMILDDDLWVKVDHKIGYDSDAGSDTYATYNSSTQYLEFWLDGVLRMEM